MKLEIPTLELDGLLGDSCEGAGVGRVQGGPSDPEDLAYCLAGHAIQAGVLDGGAGLHSKGMQRHSIRIFCVEREESGLMAVCWVHGGNRVCTHMHFLKFGAWR
eukprot:scaffold157189_cov32-Tisochrysis_lutea.AAC.1